MQLFNLKANVNSLISIYYIYSYLTKEGCHILRRQEKSIQYI